MHVQAPVVVSAVHAEPVSAQPDPELSVSEVEDATLNESCTDAPTGAEPVNINV